MTLLHKLGLGKKEETQRRPFEEIVHSSIHPQSVRANELVEICERAQQRYQKWETPNGGFSYGLNFWDDAAMALAYAGVGRPHDAEAVLRGMEYRSEGFLEDGYVCSLECYVPVIAAYSAVEEQGRAARGKLISRIDCTDSTYRNRYQELEWSEFALAHLAAGSHEWAERLVQEVLRGKGRFTPRYSLTRQAMLFRNKEPDTHNVLFNAYNNATLAIALYCLGEKNKARKVVAGIESLDTDGKGLVLNRGANNGKHVYQMYDVAPTALLSFAYSLLDESDAPKKIKQGPLSGHPYRSLPKNDETKNIQGPHPGPRQNREN